MDILIKNINPPKAEDWISLRIDADGKIVNYDGENTTWVELPPHGELIERSAVIDIIRTNPLMQSDTVKVGSLIHRVKNAPTVLEAST